MKTRKMILSSLLVTSLLSPSLAVASTNAERGIIPSQMPAGTVITFDQDNNPVITKQGLPAAKINKAAVVDLSRENPAVPNSPLSLDEYNKVLDEIREEARHLPVYYIENEKPQPGTVVSYGSDGQINTIDNAKSAISAISTYATAANGTYVYGASNNTITITDSKVSGVGRFTVFDDIMGDNSNNLVVGDVATKGQYDNPKSGTKITATANGITKIVTKNDNGTLANAVLDIWKWSGVMFGYTYSATLSFSGSYYYNR
ncbi:hypothetical protein [Paenibacillus tengchongensis]|uniref:hypothetical protein n=1 Tax=Paenibacillus tengchongensis TaxID=2608684 RepID=UPI00124BDD57|nr:hypothetical protein [Paenibacillus tengchongensis]